MSLILNEKYGDINKGNRDTSKIFERYIKKLCKRKSNCITLKCKLKNKLTLSDL